MDFYDIVIIGAGPCGLSIAHVLNNLRLNILVIDKEDTIGGCHRVKRINNMFTEHGPRIYLSSYYNLFHLMSEIGLKIDDVFTKYKYDFVHLSLTKILPIFNLYEILIFSFAYLLYLFDENYGNDINLKQFMVSYGFSYNSKDLVDKLCRYSDGADSSRYSLNKILKIFDGMFLVSIYQPKKPLDIILFKTWQKYLENKGVDFLLGHNVTYINNNNGIIDYIVVNNKKIWCGKLILAIPPASMVSMLKKNKSIANAFGDIIKLAEWKEKTEYIEYISITYHFKEDITIPTVNGLTLNTDWGVLIINLSDYMTDIENGFKKVISVAICITDKISKHTHKTANESNKNELFAEVYRQMKQSIYPNLPDNYIAILNPNNYYNVHKNKWETTDEAFFNTVGTNYIPFNSKIIGNLYNVGTQNGHSYIPYTTMESAVSNGMSFACSLYPQLQNRYYLRSSIKSRDIVLFLMTILLIIILIISALF